MNLRARTLPGFRIDAAQSRESAQPPLGRLPRSLLAYLAVERSAARDTLLLMFWPEKEEERARHSLSQAHYELRRALGENALVAAGDRLAIGPIETDLTRFEEAVESGRWRDALELYGGAFLEGAQLMPARGFEDWVDRRRAQAARLHRRARRELVAERLAAGALPDALAVCARWVELEPLDDEAQQRLIELLARTGHRAEALRQFDAFRELLRAEELEPMPELVVLAQRVASGELTLADTTSTAAGGQAAGETADTGGRPPADPVASPRMPPPNPTVLPAASGSQRRVRMVGVLALAALAVAAAGTAALGAFRRGAPATPTVAVLPFANLSGDPAVQAFVDGVHDDVLTHLYGVGSLRIISRTSVMQYRGVKKSLREIGKELGASAVLDGGVERSGDSVRINVQLADPATDQTLWADAYTRRLTAENVFALQTEIATQVAHALRARLDAGERRRLAGRPTTSLAAFDLYSEALRRFRERPRTKAELLAQIELLRRAVFLDTAYAAGFAQLSLVHQQLYLSWFDHFPAREVAAEDAALAALRLDPGLVQAHVALGAHFIEATADLARARLEFERALQLEPNNTDALRYLAEVERRQGNLQGSVRDLQRVIELDPRNYQPFVMLGEEQLMLHRNDEATRAFSRAIEVQPSWASSYLFLAWTCLARGDRARALQLLRLGHQRSGSVTSGQVVNLRFLARALAPGLDADLATLQPREVSYDTAGYLLLEADRFVRTGPADSARLYLERLRAAGEERVLRWPWEGNIYILLSVADVGLGHHDLAIQEAHRAVSLSTLQKNGGYQLMNLAWTYAATGQREKAIATLQQLFNAGGGYYSSAFLEAEPSFASLRGMPEFERLLRSAPR